MAIKLEKKTAADRLLKVISAKDDSIDWENSFSDTQDASVESKKKRYFREHDIQTLQFLPEVKPTMFVFKHPQRVDISRRIRAIYTGTIARKGSGDLFTEIFNAAFIGTEEGLDGGKMEVAPRMDGIITDGYMQALEDSGVFEEISTVFLEVLNHRNDDDKKK